MYTYNLNILRTIYIYIYKCIYLYIHIMHHELDYIIMRICPRENTEKIKMRICFRNYEKLEMRFAP